MATKTTTLAGVNSKQARRKGSRSVGSGVVQREAMREELFQSSLVLERRRAERSRKPFVLMLLEANLENESRIRLLTQVQEILASFTRETDLLGWYKETSVLGIIFTELGSSEEEGVVELLRSKTNRALQKNLGVNVASALTISLHLFPEDLDEEGGLRGSNFELYPDLSPEKSRKKISLALKRAMDVAGSGALLVLLSPILAAIALTIKLTSKGPVLFQQERMGQFGKRFKCLKFRTMYVNNNSKIHQDYIQQFIAGKMEASAGDNGAPAVYKITNDPRVTPVGRLLRKTSLDELPQFWNVLCGEMSLVGPRPPVAYEFEIYQLWHRRRVLEVKPGVTGLWQVSGRSQTQFDDMVRLDLRYLQTWSLWLDLKILLATPWAVFSGDGAY